MDTKEEYLALALAVAGIKNLKYATMLPPNEKKVIRPRGLFIIHLHLLDSKLSMQQLEAKADKVFTPSLIKNSKHDRQVLKFYKQYGLNIPKLCHKFKYSVEDASMDLLLLSDCGCIPNIESLRTL